jgi:hypothetical protein
MPGLCSATVDIVTPEVLLYGNTEIVQKETIEITRTKQINRIEHEHHKHKTLAV